MSNGAKTASGESWVLRIPFGKARTPGFRSWAYGPWDVRKYDLLLVAMADGGWHRVMDLAARLTPYGVTLPHVQGYMYGKFWRSGWVERRRVAWRIAMVPPDVPAYEWRLSLEGRKAARRARDRLWLWRVLNT